MQNTKMPSFSSKAIKSKAVIYPYEERTFILGREGYQALAKAHVSEAVTRRKAFLERLVAFKANNVSLRSYPTPGFLLPDDPVLAWDEETKCTGQLYALPPRGGGTASVAAPVSASTNGPVECSSSDDFPFDTPPLDPSQYGSVDVDDEYDRTGPTAPSGLDAQPEVSDWSKATVGTITTIGRYPFLYKEGESKTFMVRIGTKDHWGVDLERVVREFNLKKGDRIALMSIGKMPVTVPVKELQPDGSIKTAQKPAMRNTWVAKRVK